MLLKLLLFSLALACVFSRECEAQTFFYSFNGTIPAGVSNHPLIADGEAFTALFEIDFTSPDNVPEDSTLGVYENSVISGLVSFSGGYESPLSFATGDVLIANNFVDSGVFVDAVQVNSAGARFQAVTTDLASLASDQLPFPGQILNSNSVGDGTQALIQLSYTDDIGSINYSVVQSPNVNFAATAVPEPNSAALLITIVLLSNVFMRRRTPLAVG